MRPMSLIEILPDVQSLPRADKLRLIQILAQELAEAEAPSELVAVAEVPGWSLDPEFKAAEKLLEFLGAEERPVG
jgi:hypothetical protein